jgi:cytochrome c nitrite reductase small subunit
VKSRLLFLSLLLAPTVAAAGATGGVPLARGWIGTTENWAQGLGIAFAVLDLILLLSLARSIGRAGLTAASKELMFLAVAVLPLALVFFAYSYGMQASEKVEACGSCHVMGPWVKDLRDPKSETLAAMHFKNRYIQENHCYTCHSDYGMFGTVKAKWEGLGHIARYSTGLYEHPIKIARPFPNWRCLNCHGSSQKFLDPEKHPKEDLADMMSGKTSCLECHGPAHAPQTKGVPGKVPAAKAEKRASR